MLQIKMELGNGRDAAASVSCLWKPWADVLRCFEKWSLIHLLLWAAHSSDKVGGGDSNSPGLPVPPIPEPTTPELASLAPSISATEPEYQVFPMAVPGSLISGPIGVLICIHSILCAELDADGADGGCAPVVWVVPVLGLWPGISCCCISPCRCKIAFVGLCYLLEANWPTGSRQVFSSLVVESAVLLVLLPDACIAGLGVWSVADVLLAGIVLNLGGSFDAYPVDSSFGWAMLCCLSVMGSCKRRIQLLPSVVIPKIVFPALVGVIFPADLRWAGWGAGCVAGSCCDAAAGSYAGLEIVCSDMHCRFAFGFAGMETMLTWIKLSRFCMLSARCCRNGFWPVTL
ncbi:hypothetical protein Nepgr_018019 [Nepenthes gracilis]|uniref:Uncharacterized protein n=1 Tax=Nepenthes gracilis TaxID=150966 RepID=A0AAD3SRJ9_NEPGR|nr:hypothetical protein Nepgr_018019 [Nepenthes gracilis]